MSTLDKTRYVGSCLCGAISYSLSATPKAATHCHCRQCQKAHGAAFATYVSVKASDFVIDRGHEHLKRFASSTDVTRQFCAQCGSSLTWQKHSGEWQSWICISLATLDTPFVPAAFKHVYADSAPAWCGAENVI